MIRMILFQFMCAKFWRTTNMTIDEIAEKGVNDIEQCVEVDYASNEYLGFDRAGAKAIIRAMIHLAKHQHPDDVTTGASFYANDV